MAEQPGGWRRPYILLILLAVAMPLSLETWMTLINNFTIERAGFDGAKIGILHSVREVPGFLAFTAVFVLLLIREQRFAVLALGLMGVGTAVMGFLPNFAGLLVTTLTMSVGFHYFESIYQSLSLQWLDKASAPFRMGQLLAVGAVASLITYGGVWLALSVFGLDMKWVFAGAGLATLAIAGFCRFAFPVFPAKVEQNRKLILHRRYWLFYLITFLAGARRQIFVVFAGFLMVERFGFAASDIALIFIVNHGVKMLTAPFVGRLIGTWGERWALTIEYTGLVLVFAGYAFVGTAWLAVGLYIVDHFFFSMAIAIKTYFQKIADPADMAPTAGVSMTINHIAAVAIPATFGLLWLVSPAAVFLSGAALAAASLVLVRLIPRHPEPGREIAIRAWCSNQALNAEPAGE